MFPTSSAPPGGGVSPVARPMSLERKRRGEREAGRRSFLSVKRTNLAAFRPQANSIQNRFISQVQSVHFGAIHTETHLSKF